MSRLTFAANNGSIGGGEVMLLAMATAARTLGCEIQVVGPESPGELVAAAQDAGLTSTPLRSANRAQYMHSLRRWSRGREETLWCNGLVPALATAGQPRRVVHLHQVPLGWHGLTARLARARSLAVIVPSAFMARQVPGTRVLPNWTSDIDRVARVTSGSAPLRVGFVGRLSQDKGVDVLARAVRILQERGSTEVELVMAGDDRFVPSQQITAVRRALDDLDDGSLTELGWVSSAGFFASIDLAAFPSTWGEPFGLVVAEAMGSGVPFVISDAGALPEVAGPEHRWVARAGDPGDLARVIDAARAAGLDDTDAARQRWEQEFSPAAGTARFAALLADLGVIARPEASPS